jgi:hypothetical protein
VQFSASRRKHEAVRRDAGQSNRDGYAPRKNQNKNALDRNLKLSNYSATTMKRIIAIIFLLQGLCPILLFGCFTPPRHIYIVTAIIYALIAWGLWMAKRWAFVIAILITLLQTVTINSPSFSWSLFIGPTAGLFFTLPLSQIAYGMYWHIGVYFTVAFDESSASIQKIYSIQENTFVLFNVFGAILLILLLIGFPRVRQQETNT